MAQLIVLFILILWPSFVLAQEACVKSDGKNLLLEGQIHQTQKTLVNLQEGPEKQKAQETLLRLKLEKNKHPTTPCTQSAPKNPPKKP